MQPILRKSFGVQFGQTELDLNWIESSASRLLASSAVQTGDEEILRLKYLRLKSSGNTHEMDSCKPGSDATMNVRLTSSERPVLGVGKYMELPAVGTC